MRLFIVVLLSFFMVDAVAQCGINIPLQRQIERYPDQVIGLFVHGNRQAEEAVIKLGGKVKYRSGKYFGAAIQGKFIKQLAEQEGVVRLDYQLSYPSVLNDSNRVKNNVDSAFFGYSPLPGGFSGKDVVIGVIDGGLDFNHGDFKNPDGSTRVLRIWNQHQPFDLQRTPPKYGYGQVWDSTDIRAGAVSVTGQYLDHGCTVTGTVAGNAGENGFHRGVAPESDLIIVSSDFFRPDWLQSVADAVDYIVSVADSLGKPCVINASLGDYLGSHDGLDPAALHIDSLLAAKPGRIMICAGGNSGASGRYHLSYPVSASDTAFTWFRYNASMALGPGLFMEIWADTADIRNVKFALAVDQVNPAHRRRGMTSFYFPQDMENTLQHDTVWNDAGDTMATVQFYSERRDGQIFVQIYVPEPDSNSADYRFALMSTGAGHFDLWSANWLGLNDMDTIIPTATQFPQIVDYKAPDDRKIIVSSWACSPNVITVANYRGYLSYVDYLGNLQTLIGVPGTIASGSSYGPTRDNRTKPDIAATGDITLSAGSIGLLTSYQSSAPSFLAQGGMHVRNGGTSMASPVVAGAAALYLEKCSNGTPHDFWQAITSSAKQDAHTGVIPNDTFGYGKVDVFRALIETNFYPTVMGDSVICAPGSVDLMADSQYASVIWNDTVSAPVYTVSSSDSIWFFADDSYGCRGWSDTLVVEEFVSPNINIIFSDSISSMGLWSLEIDPPAGSTYNWIYLDIGDTVNTGNSPYYFVPFDNNGQYSCIVDFGNGCSVQTDTLMFLYWSVDERQLHPVLMPNPASEFFTVRGIPFGNYVGILYTAQGRLVQSWNFSQEATLRLNVPSGMYMFSIRGPEGMATVPLIVTH